MPDSILMLGRGVARWIRPATGCPPNAGRLISAGSISFRLISFPLILAGFVIAGSIIGTITGCGSQTEISTSPGDSQNSSAAANPSLPPARRSVSPANLMRGIFRRYRGANAYADQAVLIASGPEETVRAPMLVHRLGSRVRINAYSSEILIDEDELIAVADAPSHDRFDDQVLRLRRGSRSVDALLTTDALLSESLSQGAGGPPSQIDWLFADQPMKGLFDPENRFSYAAPETIEGHLCDAVRVESGDQTYRFFVDAGAGLIRRVELPPVPTSDQNGEIRLTIHLRRATFDRGQVEEMFAGSITLPEQPRWVRRLLIPPPTLDRRIGRRLAITPIDFAGAPIDFAGAPLAWLIDTDDREIKDYLNSLRDQAIADAAANRQSIRPWAIHAVASGAAVGRAGDNDSSLVLVDRDGKVHFVQSLRPPILPANLMAATADVARRVDVAGRLIQADAEATDLYRTQLKRVSVTP